MQSLKVRGPCGSLDFQTLLVLGPLQKLLLPFIFHGSNIPDKNSKLVLYYKKKLVKTQLSKKLDGKNYYCPKNLDGKNHYHPSFWSHDQKLGWEKPLPSKFLITWPKNLDSSRISIPLFLLVRFWILARNVFFSRLSLFAQKSIKTNSVR